MENKGLDLEGTHWIVPLMGIVLFIIVVLALYNRTVSSMFGDPFGDLRLKRAGPVEEQSSK